MMAKKSKPEVEESSPGGQFGGSLGTGPEFGRKYLNSKENTWGWHQTPSLRFVTRTYAYSSVQKKELTTDNRQQTTDRRQKIGSPGTWNLKPGTRAKRAPTGVRTVS